MTRSLRIVLFAVTALAVLGLGMHMRLAHLGRTIGFGTPSSWHESDVIEVARSFQRESGGVLAPRVAWRGATSGEVEMEFPFLPWLASAGFRLLGEEAWIPRLISALASCASLLVFLRLAWRTLRPLEALFATTLFTFSALPLVVSDSAQPEALQLLALLLAANAIQAWREDGAPRGLWIACAWTALAILVKSPSVHLGLVIAWFSLERYGRRTWIEPAVWIGAALALVAPVAWYAWAHRWYLRTGLSLGLSDETHFLSAIMLRHPRDWLLNGIAAIELRENYAYAGLPLAMCALLRPWRKVVLAVVWFLALMVLFVITADTAGDGWAYYYHVGATPAACLLMGHGLAFLREAAAGAGSAALLARPTVALAASAVLLTVAMRGLQSRERLVEAVDYAPMHAAALAFAEHVPPDARIVVRGGTRSDWHGHPVAFAESMVFTWMDRFGFSVAQEDMGLDELRRLARLGAGYWFAQPGDLRDADEWASAQSEYAEVARCGPYRLLALRVPGQ